MYKEKVESDSLLIEVGAKTPAYFHVEFDQFMSDVRKCEVEETKCNDPFTNVYLAALDSPSLNLASWEVERFALITEVVEVLSGEKGRKLNSSELLPRIRSH